MHPIEIKVLLSPVEGLKVDGRGGGGLLEKGRGLFNLEKTMEYLGEGLIRGRGINRGFTVFQAAR